MPPCVTGSTTGHRALGQCETMLRDVARAREPYRILALVGGAMLDGLAQRPQPERLADDESVQREREDQGVPVRLLEHLLELVHEHVGELAPGLVAPG